MSDKEFTLFVVWLDLRLVVRVLFPSTELFDHVVRNITVSDRCFFGVSFEVQTLFTFLGMLVCVLFGVTRLGLVPQMVTTPTAESECCALIRGIPRPVAYLAFAIPMLATHLMYPCRFVILR